MKAPELALRAAAGVGGRASFHSDEWKIFGLETGCDKDDSDDNSDDDSDDGDDKGDDGDSDDDGDGDGDDSDDKGDDGEDDDGWKPPTKAEWEEIQKEKRKTLDESIKRRKWLRENGINPRTGKPLAPKRDADDSDDDSDDSDDSKEKARKPSKVEIRREVDKAVARVEAESEEKTRGLLSSFYKTLEEQGWNGRSLDRILRLIDLDEVEVDGRDIVGLEDQIEDVKRDFPEWFQGRRSRPRSAAEARTASRNRGNGSRNNVDGADKGNRTSGSKGKGNQKKDWKTQIADQLMQ